MIEISHEHAANGAAKANLAGETPEEERRRQAAFDRWIASQPVPSSRYFAMADYGSMQRPLSW